MQKNVNVCLFMLIHDRVIHASAWKNSHRIERNISLHPDSALFHMNYMVLILCWCMVIYAYEC